MACLHRTPSIRISRRLKPPSTGDSISESTGDLALPTSPNSNKPTSGNQDPAVDLSRFETKDFPEVPVTAEDSTVSESADVTDAEPMKNNNMPNSVSPERPNPVAQTPPKQAEVEYYGFKMFIFVLFILALIMIPIAIVWETRKTYLRTTTVYRSFARWVFRSFGYRL